MNKDPFLKLESSKIMEDLLNDPDPSTRQNWLLSYLDVFVLIVMLIISLISVSEFKTEEEKASSPQKSKPVVPKQSEEAAKKPTQKIITGVVTKAQPSPIELEQADSEKLTNEILTAPAPANKPIVPPIETIETIETKSEVPPDIENTENQLQIKLSEKLDQLGLDQKVNLKVTEDYAQLEIQDNILFESSKAILTPGGQTLLNSLSGLLNQATGLIFIEGHTDNRPIKTKQFPTNWELGAARATNVLHYLTTQGLDAKRLRAVSYADTQPIAGNDSAEGRKKNRRVSLLLKIREKDL
ncbi:OmpA family protein [Methylicorpusculum oleiharenae]|uniref:OmpA/MotB family protein n=1 Tax=Methylicorpusculum oleiharenae TaxID=1338687 RepID=UPI001357D598|nr:OmpA family protein [Methylicorpusculum oleiharenae]MCD2452969.1 OmpA family protein [Methylicorpusculum oleiharenae]